MNELITASKEEVTSFINTFHVQKVLDEIKKFTASFVQDMGTEQGRKDIDSLAKKINRSKTYIDGIGKEIVTELKAKPKLIDSERKKARDFLDNLKDEIRKPLTDWENTEKERIERHESNMFSIKVNLNISVNDPLSEIEKDLIHLNNLDLSTYEEFQNRASMYLKDSILHVEKVLEEKKAIEKAKEDHERLVKENEELERKNREARAIKEAEEKARKEAETKAKIEKENLIIENKKKEQDLIDAKNREQALKIKMIEDEKRIIEEQKQLAEKMRLDEIERKELEERRLKDIEEKRIANIEHQRSIHLSIIKDLNDCMALDSEVVKELVRVIVNGRVRNLKVIY